MLLFVHRQHLQIYDAQFKVQHKGRYLLFQK